MKNAKIQNHYISSILNIYTNVSSSYILTCFLLQFFTARFLYMHIHRTTLYLVLWAGPAGLQLYGSGSPCLPGSVRDGKRGLAHVHVIRNLTNEIFHFFSIFHLFQKVILHKMLKLGFWNFYWLHFFLKLTFVCLSWYLHLNPSSANPTKWSNFYRRIVWVCLIILWGWRLKG